MSDGYVKVYESILQSTIWLESPDTKIVWITMLTLKDKEGVVRASIPGLAKTAGVTIEACEAAINCFLSPDPYSRTQDFEGRRIRQVDGGWFLINHAKYRDLRTQKNINDAERKRKSRENDVTPCHTMSHDVTHRHGVSGDGDGDVVNLEKKSSKKQTTSTLSSLEPNLADRRRKVIDAYNLIAERNDWFIVDGKPNGTAMDLLNKFCEDEYRFGKMDEYMSKVAQSTMEACRINVFLTKRAFNNIMAGNWCGKKDSERKGGVDGPSVPEEALDLSKPWNRPPEPEKRSTGIWDNPEGLI